MTVLLDGAIGTQLAAHGVDITRAHWSAAAIRESPEVLALIHEQYVEAGARVVTANTFRTTRHALAKVGLERDAAALTREAVVIARRASDAASHRVQIAGSVAPLEDCYTPGATPDDATCRSEHAMHIENLMCAGVDLLLIETMPTAREAVIALEVACEQVPAARVIASCVCTGDGEPGTLLDGSAMQPVLDAAIARDIRAVGINCVAAPDMATHIASVAERVARRVGIVAYANTGRLMQGGSWQETDATDPARYAKYAKEWVETGATIVGGCCGTTPATIAAVAEAIDCDEGYRASDV